MPKLFAALLCIFFLVRQSYGQDSASATEFIRNARNSAVSSYYQFAGKQARLYNGIDHTGYYSSIKGTAYYVNDSLLKGTVVYDGLLYKDVSMIYDTYQDEVVILHFNGLRMSLLSEKLREFTFRNHHFVRHVYDSLAASSVPTGFYDYLYEGKVTALVHRITRLEEKVTDVVTREFLLNDKYYIYKNGVYHAFKGYHGLLVALRPKSKEVKRHLKKNKIRFKDDPEWAIVEAAKYYDTLN